MEGRTGGGYDVKINGNIFFQFKIPEHITRPNSQNARQWPIFNQSFYRIKIDTNSRQFELLKDLQNPSNRVYYATPNFHTETDISTKYQYDQIVNSSSLFPIQNFPPYNSGHHQLIYRPDNRLGTLFSEPTKIKKEENINPFELFKDRKEDTVTIFEQSRDIFKVLKSKGFLIQGDLPFNDNKPADFVKAVHNILLTQYNIHWYPVISRRQ
jgi:hypothetical protein